MAPKKSIKTALGDQQNLVFEPQKDVFFCKLELRKMMFLVGYRVNISRIEGLSKTLSLTNFQVYL